MRVSNPQRSRLRIDGRDPAQAPPSFLETVGDYLPGLQCEQCLSEGKATATSPLFALLTQLTVKKPNYLLPDGFAIPLPRILC